MAFLFSLELDQTEGETIPLIKMHKGSSTLPIKTIASVRIAELVLDLRHRSRVINKHLLFLFPAALWCLFSGQALNAQTFRNSIQFQNRSIANALVTSQSKFVQTHGSSELHDAIIYYEQGLIAGREGRHDEAVASFQLAINLKPDFAEAHNNLGFSYHRLGQNRKALEALNRALQLKPDMAIAYSNLGNVHITLGQSKRAVQFFNEALRLGLDDEVTRCSLGVAYYRLKRYNEASDSFQQAIRIKADYSVAHYNLGVAYLALKNKNLALGQHAWLKDVAPSLATQLFQGIYRNKVLVVTQE